MIVLEFINREFVEVSGTPSTDIYLQVKKENDTMELHLGKGASLIECRTAERQARSLAVSGVHRSNGERLGQGYRLVVNSDNSMPDRLKKTVKDAYSLRNY